MPFFELNQGAALLSKNPLRKEEGFSITKCNGYKVFDQSFILAL
jgi:hypothetical protein